ncbi:hypothetical protein FNV43_RR21615 [Rhamnella rubrinervis]|uniref:Uncharacterized protein n=1 Tax=Rhamnella rubrinervis TaxID=2594499 RepID=A0A8K0GUC7_9ROSA|nr:hypothetical protein FNV43_RR21615 [Rhamnella rubrinervis]
MLDYRERWRCGFAPIDLKWSFLHRVAWDHGEACSWGWSEDMLGDIHDKITLAREKLLSVETLLYGGLQRERLADAAFEFHLMRLRSSKLSLGSIKVEWLRGGDLTQVLSFPSSAQVAAPIRMSLPARFLRLDGIIRTSWLRMKTQFNGALDSRRLGGGVQLDVGARHDGFRVLSFGLSRTRWTSSVDHVGKLPFQGGYFGCSRGLGKEIHFLPFIWYCEDFWRYLSRMVSGALCRFPPRNSSSQTSPHLCGRRAHEAYSAILRPYLSDFGAVSAWKAVPTDGGRLCLINFGDYLEIYRPDTSSDAVDSMAIGTFREFRLTFRDCAWKPFPLLDLPLITLFGICLGVALNRLDASGSMVSMFEKAMKASLSTSVLTYGLRPL